MDKYVVLFRFAQLLDQTELMFRAKFIEDYIAHGEDPQFAMETIFTRLAKEANLLCEMGVGAKEAKDSLLFYRRLGVL